MPTQLQERNNPLADVLLIQGQALLIVLLSMAVVLTMVLSVVSRSITDVTLSTKEEEAMRAFSAAEAGIENTLLSGEAYGDTFIGDAKYSTTITDLGEGSNWYALPGNFYSGETGTVWYVSRDANGNFICDDSNPCYLGRTLQVCWGNQPGNEAQPAVEVTTYVDPNSDGQYSDVRVLRSALDPDGSRRANNYFSAAGGACSINGKDYPYSANISLDWGPGSCIGRAKCLLFSKIKLLYNTAAAHPLAVSVANGTLPSQGQQIDASGISGEANRKLRVTQSNNGPANIFEAVLYTQGQISQDRNP